MHLKLNARFRPFNQPDSHVWSIKPTFARAPHAMVQGAPSCSVQTNAEARPQQLIQTERTVLDPDVGPSPSEPRPTAGGNGSTATQSVSLVSAASSASVKGQAVQTSQQGTGSPGGPPVASKSNQAEEAENQSQLRVEDAWQEFEQKLEADLATVGTTILGILGVIIFWRGVWSLLDYILGDGPLGDLFCILAGLGIILYIRLAGLRVGSFWPSS
uniref:Uncharacterized protein n=1 Tax=Chlamydomonas leiostraca TaxID=1034604 RepID=A0A7S0RSU2_9CHLO|mmetsp:Transcript_30679/g.78378  ORF Transcript_30679/g.78378 Transcript_30679/m.78378 type:complete len:215 (+) Transcript_30679:212-856(+)